MWKINYLLLRSRNMVMRQKWDPVFVTDCVNVLIHTRAVDKTQNVWGGGGGLNQSSLITYNRSTQHDSEEAFLYEFADGINQGFNKSTSRITCNCNFN